MLIKKINQNLKSPSHARAEGLAFLLGVVVTMVALAAVLLLARTGGASVGWGFLLQSPLVIAALESIKWSFMETDNK
nr:hypothetical protein [Pantoea ananatis]